MSLGRAATAALFSLTLVAGAARPARAELRIGAEALADVPVDLGVRGWFEMPFARLRLSLTVGVMPSFFYAGWNGMARPIRGYSEQTGDAFGQALKNSFVGRLHVGVRPMKERGFYVDAGYAVVGFGGDVSTASLLDGASGQAAPTDMGGATYQSSAVLHMVDLEVGWQWRLFWQFTLRVALGASWVFAATSSLKPTFEAKLPDEQTRYTRSVTEYLDGRYRNIVTPYATLAIGWQIL